MVTLRPYRESDLDALYAICLQTGDSGADATGQHNDPKAVGHLYAAPYGVLEPQHVFVAEDDAGVAGYVVGTFDTRQFEEWLESEWFPPLRTHYADVSQEVVKPADRMRIEAIMTPGTNPAEIVAAYPAHIHMNLLPRLRGQRVGTGLLERWIDAARAGGVRGIHLGANSKNAGGIAFWSKSGFQPVAEIARTTWFGMNL
ncbi:MAG: GNAT family N-acetyltransferase [Candidatus Devosia phytovorans]|uniref:GNAT family N-acetyltransferase n=1 Tax=Candidatus Devosia phytovorans TaxID=3121372 RepID=A0AAJ6B1B7_9HYPH|nr:GNAT family N-acetyltransferase [Devosia sp.]WEK06620.1 MAG: GNAT family N-acetyltransferase [Devosia sp.]